MITWRIDRFPVVTSTNDMALDRLREGCGEVGHVLVAESQIAGRGRRGRIWHSPRGALMLTAILPFAPERAGWTALAAGIAVARAARACGAPAGVKWPNDVVVHPRKLAGILVESCVPEKAAVGIGLNVTNPVPDGVAACRLEEWAPDADVDEVLPIVLAELAAVWALLHANSLRSLRHAWDELDTTAGREVEWATPGRGGEIGILQAVAEGVTETGELRLRLGDGRVVAAGHGEIRFTDPEPRGAETCRFGV